MWVLHEGVYKFVTSVEFRQDGKLNPIAWCKCPTSNYSGSPSQYEFIIEDSMEIHRIKTRLKFLVD